MLTEEETNPNVILNLKLYVPDNFTIYFNSHGVNRVPVAVLINTLCRLQYVQYYTNKYFVSRLAHPR